VTHGITAYTRGCRCDECAAAWRIYTREYDYECRHVGRRTVAITPVLEHLDALFARGHTSGSIARATGVPAKTVLSIRSRGSSGERQRVRRRIADAILGMTLDAAVIGDRNLVPAEHIRPMVREMLRSGLRHEDLRVALGGGFNAYHVLRRQRSVSSVTARRVHILYQIRARHGLVPPIPEEVTLMNGGSEKVVE
jgi:hypothetical protein